MKRTLTFYSVLFILSLALSRGSGALAKMALANAITPYEYGIITLVTLSLPSFFQLATNLTFSNMLIHAEEGKKYFGFTLVYSLLMTAIVSVVLFFFSRSFFLYLNLPLDKSQVLYAVIIISLLPLSILADYQGLLTGLRIYSLPGIIMALPSIFRLSILVISIYIFKINSFNMIIFVFALSNTAPLIYILASKRLRDFFGLVRSVKIPSKKIFAFSTTLFIIGSFSTIGQSLIKIVISHELGIDWQGYYDVSLTVASILLFSLGTMGLLVIPEATSSDKDALYEKGGLADVSRGLLSLLIFLLMILYFYSDYLVAKLFSKNYLIASKYVYILAIGYLFLFIQTFVSNLNLSKAKIAKDYILLTLIPLCLLPLFFFLTKFLITFFYNYGYGNGFIGAYLSYAVLLILYALITVYFSKDLIPLKVLLHKADRLMVAGTITFLFLYFVTLQALIGIIVSGVLFTVLVFFSGYLKKSLLLEMFGSSKT
jgi:O-antigen/teichoic acid export membrane protein